MKLYDPNLNLKDLKEAGENPEEMMRKMTPGMALGFLVGLATVCAFETTIAWLILTFLVGVSLTWLQVFGIILIANGLSAKVFGK